MKDIGSYFSGNPQGDAGKTIAQGAGMLGAGILGNVIGTAVGRPSLLLGALVGFGGVWTANQYIAAGGIGMVSAQVLRKAGVGGIEGISQEIAGLERLGSVEGIKEAYREAWDRGKQAINHIAYKGYMPEPFATGASFSMPRRIINEDSGELNGYYLNANGHTYLNGVNGMSNTNDDSTLEELQGLYDELAGIIDSGEYDDMPQERHEELKEIFSDVDEVLAEAQNQYADNANVLAGLGQIRESINVFQQKDNALAGLGEAGFDEDYEDTVEEIIEGLGYLLDDETEYDEGSELEGFDDEQDYQGDYQDDESLEGGFYA